MTSGRIPAHPVVDSSHSTVEAYQSAILSAISPLMPTRLELADAEGCVLAEDVTAAVSLPSFDNSSMDGYAVVAADIDGASEEAPSSCGSPARSRPATSASTGWSPAPPSGS